MARLLHDAREPSVEEFRDEVLACHRRLTAASGGNGWQVPWPRALGTPPWAVKRELESVTGVDHVLHLARLGQESRAEAFDRLAVAGGALYVGSRALPRHVLLALAAGPEIAGSGPALRCYQPSRGTVVTLPREEFVHGNLSQAGWPYPWFTVAPKA